MCTGADPTGGDDLWNQKYGRRIHGAILYIARGASLSACPERCARNEAARDPKARPALGECGDPVISRKVTEFDELTGRFASVERRRDPAATSQVIVPRSIHEGARVKKGDVLFVIGPPTLSAERDKAQRGSPQARSQLVSKSGARAGQ